MWVGSPAISQQVQNSHVAPPHPTRASICPCTCRVATSPKSSDRKKLKIPCVGCALRLMRPICKKEGFFHEKRAWCLILFQKMHTPIIGFACVCSFWFTPYPRLISHIISIFFISFHWHMYNQYALFCRFTIVLVTWL